MKDISIVESNISTGIHVPPLQLRDLWTAIFIFFYLSSGQIPGWSLSPIAFLTLGLGSYLLLTKTGLPYYMSNADRRAFWTFSVLIIWNIASLLVYKSSIGSFIISASMLCSAGIAVSYSKEQNEHERLIFIFFLILSASMIIFLASNYSSSIALRIEPYIPSMDRTERFIPKGLSRAGFIFGYQMTSLCLIFLFLSFISNNFLMKFCFVLGFGLAFWSLFIQGSRSGFISVIVALAVFTGARRSIKKLIGAIAIITMAFLVLNIGYQEWLPKTFVGEYYESRGTLFERFYSTQDYDIRSGMQKYALGLLLEYPLGLRAAGQEWDWLLYTSTDLFKSYETVLAVHNGFLGYALVNGWLPSLALLILVFYGVRISWRMLKSETAGSEVFRKSDIIPLCFIADQVNALSHNACFVNEPFSAILFLLLISQHSLMVPQQKSLSSSVTR